VVGEFILLRMVVTTVAGPTLADDEAMDHASFDHVILSVLDWILNVHPVLKASRKCLKLRFIWAVHRVLMAGVINRVIPGFTDCHPDFISLAVPPARFVDETVHVSVAPVPETWVDQQFGREVPEKFSLKGREKVPHSVVASEVVPIE
jgi:hypothetical protein